MGENGKEKEGKREGKMSGESEKSEKRVRYF